MYRTLFRAWDGTEGRQELFDFGCTLVIFADGECDRISLFEGLRVVPEEGVDVRFRFYLVDVVACVEVPSAPRCPQQSFTSLFVKVILPFSPCRIESDSSWWDGVSIGRSLRALLRRFAVGSSQGLASHP